MVSAFQFHTFQADAFQTVPTTDVLIIKVAGTNRTANILFSSLAIENVLTKQIDSCSFLARNFTVNLKDEVIVDNAAETARYFAGYVSFVNKRRIKSTDFYNVECQDYTIRLETTFVNKIYSSQTCKQIIADAFATLTGFDIATYVQDGATVDRIVCNRMSLRELIEKLCTISGFDYYVDYNKNLRFFAKETNAAPFGLGESNIGSVEQLSDGNKLINKVFIYGGDSLSEDTNFYLSGDGYTTEKLLPYELYAPSGYSQVRVFLNSGTNDVPIWNEKTVGIDGIDTLATHNVLFNRNEKLLKFAAAHVPLNLAKAVKVSAKYIYPICGIIRDYASYTTHGAWFEMKVVDRDIQSKDLAWKRGQAELVKYSSGQRVYNLKTWTDGLAAGQLAQLDIPTWSVSGTFLIQRVSTKFLTSAGKAEYNVEVGDYIPSVVDYLIELKRLATPYLEVKEGEKLLEYLDQSEFLALAEATDLHSDAFPPDVSRWIAEPPAQGAGHHVRHEALALVDSTSSTSHAKNNYLWDSFYWDFATWG